MLRRETPIDVGTPMTSFGLPRRDRAPTLRERETDLDPAERIGGLWHEEEVASGHQREPFPDVPITSAGEAHVRVPLALSRLDEVADCDGGGERSSNNDSWKQVAAIPVRDWNAPNLDG